MQVGLDLRADAERLGEGRRPDPGAQEDTIGAPHACGRRHERAASVRLHGESLLPHEAVAQPRDERGDRRPHADPAAADVEQRTLRGRAGDRQHVELLLRPQPPVVDPRRGEERRDLVGVGRHVEHALGPDERRPGPAAPAVPPLAGAADQLDEVGPVVDVAKDPDVPGGLASAGLRPLETANVHTRVEQRVRGRQADDTASHDEHLGGARLDAGNHAGGGGLKRTLRTSPSSTT